MAMSSFSVPAMVSSLVSCTRERCARIMSSDTSSSTRLAAIWNAGNVMPRYWKIHLPINANTSSTAAATRHASRAILMRCSGVSRAVIARKAGMLAIGSTITNIELNAMKVKARRLMARKVEG